MSDTTHVTSFRDHAKRASVDVPEGLRDALPFDPGESLGVNESDGEIAVVADPTPRGARAVLRGTDSGLRLYVDRAVAYEADLLTDGVELSPTAEGLRLSATDH